MSEKGQGRSWPLGKINSLSKPTSGLIERAAAISRKLMHERILNGNCNMLHSPDAVLLTEYRNLPALVDGCLKIWCPPICPNEIIYRYIYVFILVYIYIYG